MTTNLEILNSKIYSSLEDLNFGRRLTQWRLTNNKFVFTNGCFDILHRGHVEYLSKAAELGNKMIIGLNTDSSIKRLKGEKRPINDWLSRAIVLASLTWVDAVVGFDDDTPIKLIEFVKPHYLVKGGDYIAQNVVGYNFVKQNGGDTIIIPFVEGYSTTNIINKSK
ncbi:MAG: D-glycero-beta-D-manno-heptose 1-phosphate adenylyltransferase [Bacteroidales bacterium]|nr:D-glycero-beta-D-manno-heptose 1-phosphate adenylyltransferase [Bacteroidales bacterium]